MKDMKKNRRQQIYSYLIPTALTIGYITYLVGSLCCHKDYPTIQDSENFGSMLEVLVTFMSIILSVFGFLIPSFIGSKGESTAIKYFMKYANMKVFAINLKNIVAIGLIDTFLTCILFLRDIFSCAITNSIICIWLWCLLFFLCNSYRFISIIINLLLTEKQEFTQEVANEESEIEREELNNLVRKI